MSIHQENDMLINSNDEKDITRLCLMAKEGIENRDTSDNDNDDDVCKSDDEEEEEETEYDVLDEVYNFLNN